MGGAHTDAATTRHGAAYGTGDGTDLPLARRVLRGAQHVDMATWMEGPEAAGFFRVTRWVTGALAWRERLGFEGGDHDVNSENIEEAFEAAGAYVMGRRMADGGEVPWGDDPPFHAPVFVVTHRPRETLVKQGGTSFTYVTTAWGAPSSRPASPPTARTWRSPAVAACCNRGSARACSI